MADPRTVVQCPLTIPRGGVFRAHAWVLLDQQRQPLRTIAGLTVVSKIRPHRTSTRVLHVFAAQAALLVIPGSYGGTAVATAQLDEISAAGTGQMTFEVGVYDVLVNGEPIVEGPVLAPVVVSR